MSCLFPKIETDRVDGICETEEQISERVLTLTRISCKTPDQLEFLRYVDTVEIVHRFRAEGAKCE